MQTKINKRRVFEVTPFLSVEIRKEYRKLFISYYSNIIVRQLK